MAFTRSYLKVELAIQSNQPVHFQREIPNPPTAVFDSIRQTQQAPITDLVESRRIRQPPKSHQPNPSVSSGEGNAHAFEVASFVGLKAHHKSAQGKATNRSAALRWMNHWKTSPVRAAQRNCFAPAGNAVRDLGTAISS
jgi:hypothetical protein